MGLKFTQQSIAVLACPEGRKDAIVFDSTRAGFGVRVTAKGTKTFLAQYKMGEDTRRVPVGQFGDLTVKQAWDRVLAVLGDAKEGRDPFAERKARKAATRAAAAAAKARRSADEFTFAALIDAWELDRSKAGRREGYLKPAVASLRRHFEAWLSRPTDSITDDEAARRIERIEAEAGPMAANRALSYARAAYARGVQKKLIPANPFLGIEPVAEEKSRDRVLDDEEIGAIWRAADTLPSPYGAFLRALLLTGQRRNEVAGMRWSELSADLATWSLPSTRAKNSLAHIVHLAEPAREILRGQPRLKDCPYVFPGERNHPVCAFSFAKRLLDRAMTQERTGAGIEPAEPAAWVLHDFRRTAVSWMASAGIASDVADRILNHREGKAQGVKGVYQRYEFLPERKAALDAWARHVLVCAAAQPSDDNIAEFTEAERAKAAKAL